MDSGATVSTDSHSLGAHDELQMLCEDCQQIGLEKLELPYEYGPTGEDVLLRKQQCRFCCLVYTLWEDLLQERSADTQSFKIRLQSQKSIETNDSSLDSELKPQERGSKGLVGTIAHAAKDTIMGRAPDLG